MQKIYELATELRHELHQHPELAGEEVWTKARLIRFLQENTKLEIVDKGKWFYAAYKGGGDKPGIGFRADFDALPFPDNVDVPYVSLTPGKGHKCGHDGHAATLCAFAMALEKKQVKRNVYLVFQHGEEVGMGGKECEDFVPETGIQEIYAWHNTNGYEFGTVELFETFYACGSVGMNITMTGTPSHASRPEDGNNPAVPLAKVVAKIPEIADQSKFETLVMATIVEVNIGEHAFGIAASKGNIGVTLRSLNDSDMYVIRDQIVEYAAEVAKEAGLQVEFSYEDLFPDCKGDAEHCEKIRQAAIKCGLPYTYAPAPNRGSEDFGWFLKQCPGSMFDLSCGVDTPSIHTNEFDFDDNLIPKALDMMLTLTEM